MSAKKWNIKLLEPSFSPWQSGKDNSKSIAVLMSGGVDSSITAHLLKEQGWDVLGITMKIPVSAVRHLQAECNTSKRGCCGADAAFVCHELDIPHYYIDVTEPFEELIIKQFRQSYAKGQTPNPCVDCNTLIKFSLLWDFVEETFGTNYLATGHYAKVTKVNGQNRLGRAKDKTKDQSYFIYGITRDKLQRFVLPLGESTKDQVRSTAARLNLIVADKAESMELCFAGAGDYRLALEDTQANRQGDITDMHGNKIGTHKGISNYTLGQRQGIGYAGGKPLYVGRIDADANTITLGTREEVSTHTVTANRINILIPEEFVPEKTFLGKIRSYGDPQPCKLINISENKITAEFDQPQFAPCPGQRLVLYNNDDDIVVGGTISAQN